MQSKFNRETSPLTQQLRNLFGFGDAKKKLGRSSSKARRKLFMQPLEERRVLATMYAVDTNDNLLTFDSATPGTIATNVAITGIGAGEDIVGIDVRPATGELYAFGLTDDGATRTGRILKINPATAAATPVGGNFSTSLSDTGNWGMDFNPLVDRIRIISRNQENLRVNPNDGTLAGTDANTSIDGINGIAYDRNEGTPGLTTLYAYDFDNDDLGTIGGIDGTPSPNGGAYNLIGDTGITAVDRVTFDIEAVTNIGRITANGNLYTINLATGATTLVGGIGGAPSIRGLTTASSVAFLNGTAGADAINLVRSGANVIATGVAGGPVTFPIGALTGIVINGLAGADTMTVDYSGGNFGVAVTVNGGAPATNPGDRLVTTGGNFATGTSNPINGNDGALVYTGGTTGNATINYTGLEPIDDLNFVVNYVINATNGLNFINIVNGPVVLGTQTTQVNDGAVLFELVNFANKTNVTVNALDGSDQISINNSLKGVGLTALIVNGGNGDDQFNINGPGIVAGTTYTFNGGNDNDLFSVSGGLLGAPITINGDSHTGGTPSTSDRLTVNSSASDVTQSATQLQFSGGSAITFGTLEQINLNNLNTLSVAGTGAADSILLTKPSATTYRSVLNSGIEVNFDAPVATVGAQYFANPAGGSDILTIDNTGRVVNLRVAYNAGAGTNDVLNVFGNPGVAVARESYIVGATEDAGRLVLDPDGNLGYLKTSVAVANGDELDVSFNGLDPIFTDVPSTIFDVVLSSAIDSATLQAGPLLNGAQSMNLIDNNATFESTQFANKGTVTVSGFTATDTLQWFDNGVVAAGLTNLEFYGFLPIGLGVDDAPGSNTNRDRVQVVDDSGAVRNVLFDHGIGNSSVAVTGTTRPVQIGTAETISYVDNGSNDNTTVRGTTAGDDLTVVPVGTSSTLVFQGGDPWDGPNEGSMFDQFPGIAGGSIQPDIILSGLGSFTANGGAGVDNQLYVYGQSETALSTGATDYFGFGAGVLIPNAAGLGLPNAFDRVDISATQVRIRPNDGAINFLPVNINTASFVQATPLTFGLIVNSGDEAAPGIPDPECGLRADNIFVTPSTTLSILANGGNPTPAGAPQGDKINIGGNYAQIDVFSDKSTPPVVSMVFTPFGPPTTATFAFSSIECFGPLFATTVRLIGDNNNPLNDQTDNFVVRGGDVDSDVLDTDGFPIGDDDGCQEFTLQINGSNIIPFSNVSFLEVHGNDITDAAPFTGATADDIDTLDIQANADNTPNGWCIDVFFNESTPNQDDGGQQDLLIYHTSIGLGGGGTVSESITVAPSGPDNGEVRVVNTAFGTPIVLIQYVANTDIVFVDDDAGLSDIDTITLLGTVPETPQTSGNDRITVDFNAAGGVATPKYIFQDDNTAAILYRVRDILNPIAGTGFQGITIKPLAGNDVVTIAGAIPASFIIDLGAGNDSLTATTAIGPGLTVFGGDGSDFIQGSAGPDLIYGGAGDDLMMGGGGGDIIYGQDGDDFIGGTPGNPAAEDASNDQFIGGAGSDTFVWDPGDGNDTIEGGEDEGDTIIFNGNAGAEQFTLSALQTRLRIFRAQGNIQLSIAGVENVQLNAGDGADTVTVNDLSHTAVREVAINAVGAGIADGAADAVTVFGRSLADVIDVSGGALGFTVSGLQYDVDLNNLGDATDSFTIDGQGGNDFISSSVPGLIGLFTLSGNAGDDTLVGGASNEILLGGAGNDFIDAGAGVDTLRGGDGDDVMIPGNDGVVDTVDGGAGWDQILFRGTAFRDGITAVQTSDIAVTYSNTTGAVVETDTLAALTVEELRIEAGSGNDTVLVSQDAAAFTAPGLQITVDGGSATTQDRLGVVDAGAANATIQRLGADGTSGTFNIGQVAAAIVYTNVEYARLEGVDPITGLTAAGGRLYVFKVDSFEQNGSIPNATHLGVGETLNQDPTIDPGSDNLLNLTGDEDFYRVEALRTGTLDFQVFFRPDADLPGGGNLTVTVLDSTGAVVAATFSVASALGARVRVPSVQGQIYYLRVDGTTEAAVNVYDISVINEAAPTPFELELTDAVFVGTNPPGGNPSTATDTGRSQFDNITFDNTPTILLRLNDRFFTSDIPGNDLVTNPPIGAIPLNHIPNAVNPSFRIAIFDEGPATPPQTPLGFATLVTAGVYTFTSPLLLDGSHFLTARVQMIDPVHGFATGFGDRSLPLEIIVDTLPPTASFGLAATVNDGLDPGTDSGVQGHPGVFVDRATNDTTPKFWGQAEANTVIRLFLDTNANGVFDAATDLLVGQTVATPLDGTNQFPTGRWDIELTTDLNNVGLPKDGLRTFFITAEDLAGNVTSPPGVAQTLQIMVDTVGPQVTNVFITSDPGYYLFDLKQPNGQVRPTPLVNSLSISVQDLPNRVAQFLYGALQSTGLDPAVDPGNFQLVGDANGQIAIQSITYVPNAVVAGAPATGTLVLGFFKPLPDDRFTLTLKDGIQDPVGNKLDGESNRIQPQPAAPFEISGDGVSGGNFVVRFTVDSRPEVGTWNSGSIYVDTNGNQVFDPTNSDHVNRDITYVMGYASDNMFAGNFTLNGGAVADGFDKIAAYGKVGSKFRWLIDFTNDGVSDFDKPDPLNLNGLPVAGNFDGNAANGDEVGIFTGTSWVIDKNLHDFQLDTVIPSNMTGRPVVGDFNGDGADDFATWADDFFQVDTNRDGQFDVRFRFGFPGVRERPVAADMDKDGIDDLGLWAPDRDGVSPREGGEYYFLVSGGASLLGRIQAGPLGPEIRYKPTPFGNDFSVYFGDEFAQPIVGNFDPPIAPNGAVTSLTTNPNNSVDVNNDGVVSTQDALLVLEAYSNRLQSATSTSVYMVDVNGDGRVSAADILAVISTLTTNSQNRSGGAASGEAGSQPSSMVSTPSVSATSTITTTPANTRSTDQAIGQVANEVATGYSLMYPAPLAANWSSTIPSSSKKNAADKALIDLFG